jgi:hypothetical protein
MALREKEPSTELFATKSFYHDLSVKNIFVKEI